MRARMHSRLSRFSTHSSVAAASSIFSRAPLIVDPVHHQSTLILCHDRYDDPDRYRSVFTLLGQLANSIRLVLPWAPLDPDTDSPCWSHSKPNPVIASAIKEILHKESNTCRNVFLGGIGEGADLALEVGVNSTTSLSGIVSFSPTKIPAARHNQVPILAFHGYGNMLLPVDEAKRKYQKLGQVDFNTDPSIEYAFRHEMFVQMCFWIQDMSN